jgi:hypothetical protein
MPTPVQVLSKFAEKIPRWLANYQAGSPFPREAFFDSKILYYPGSETDGHPLCVFGKSHAVHCFVYADYYFSRVEVERQLRDTNDHAHPLGYRLLSLVDVADEELMPYGWMTHERLAPPDVKFADTLPPEGPFIVFAVLEREEVRGDDHGPKRLAILHVGRDCYDTFKELFCLEGSKPPYAVLLQDHSTGDNWNKAGFGGESQMWSLAKQKGEPLPQWLFVATDNTEPWPSYRAVSDACYGGSHTVPRVLFAHDACAVQGRA